MSQIQNSKFKIRESAIENRKPVLSRAEGSKIAIDGRYIQDHFPGIGRYTFNLIDALARVAPDEQFVLFHNPALRNTRYGIAALARHPNVELRRVDVPTFSLREQFQLPILRLRSGQASNIQLLHSPYFIKPYFLRVPSVVTLFDVIPLRFPGDLPNARARVLFRLLVGLAARTAARVIAPSFAAREDLHTLLHVPRDKIAVVPLAADARFAPQSDAEIARVRGKYQLPTQYVLTVGINKPHKNLAALVEAFAQFAIRNSQSAIPLVIAGAWDERYASVISRQSLVVRFIRDVDDADLPALYAGAAVFVFPSLYEGFGLPPLEAMACGAPVVSSNAPALPEVVGDAAVLVNPRAADELAAAITRVLSDAALRDELRAKSLARAARFSWERCARATLQVYASVKRGD